MTELALTANVLLNPGSSAPVTSEVAPELRRRASLLGRRLSGADYIARNWPASSTTVTALRDYPATSPEDWITVPGFGSTCGLWAAQLLEAQLPTDRSIYALDIASNGTDPDEINHLISSHVASRQTEQLSGYCHSMGFLRFLSAVRFSTVHVNRVIMDGSPTSVSAMRFGERIVQLASAIERTGYKGGLGGKFGVALAREIDKNGYRQPLLRLQAAQRDTVTGGSPLRHIKEIREIPAYERAQLLDTSTDQYAGKIDGDTHIIFLHAADHRRDNSIIISQSIAEISKFARERQAALTIMPVTDSGHGDTARSLEAAQEWIAATNTLVA